MCPLEDRGERHELPTHKQRQNLHTVTIIKPGDQQETEARMVGAGGVATVLKQ